MSMQVRDSRLLKRSIPAVLCLAAVAVPFAGTPLGRIFAGSSIDPARPVAPVVAFGDVAGRTVVEAAERGSAWVRFEDGVEIATEGDAKAGGPALGMLRADFDNDGVPDLAVVSGSGSSGTIRMYRGNLGATFPNAPESREASAAGTPVGAPFHLPPSTSGTPLLPELSAAGDFDGDGNADAAVASVGGDTVFMLPGDGRGGFGIARSVAITGTVTALGAGDVDRPDGRAELLIGTEMGQSAQILIVTGGTFAGAGVPEVVELPSPAREIAHGDVTAKRFPDILVATESGAVVIPGRDSAFEPRRDASEVFAAGRAVRSIAIGNFTGGSRADAALLLESGSIDLIVGPDPVSEKARADHKPTFVSDFASASIASRRLVAANASSRVGDDLMVIDRHGRSIGIVEGGEAVKSDAGAPVQFRVDGEPVAGVPMRLNPDGIDDLVVVTSESVTPVVMHSSRLRAPFVVTNTNDLGASSLRDAITQANMLAGADTISFSIAGAGPHVINLSSELPQISETLSIDGSTEPDFAGSPIVVLNGTALAMGSGLDVGPSTAVTIRSLVINNFPGTGILLTGSTGTIVEGCHIGTNVAGTVAAPNAGGGVVSLNTGGGTIGGTTTAARNVISGNGAQGVQAQSNSAGVVISGNFIGVTAAGSAPLGNALNGVEINNASSTIVGGSVAGSTNVISGNTAGGGLSNGVYDHGGQSSSNSVLGNIIGLASNGTTVIGNGANGVLGDSQDFVLGGVTAGSRNVVSGNLESGFRCESQALFVTVFGNYFGLDVNGTTAKGNGDEGVWLAGGGVTDVGGLNAGEGNVMSGNGISGVKISGGFDHNVIGNKIGSNATGAAAVPNALSGVRLEGGAALIIGNNKIAGNAGDGIAAIDASGAGFTQNELLGNGGHGIDLEDDGFTPNDVGDADMGALDLQNFPIITSAVTNAGVTTVMGTLNSEASMNYRIEVFINGTCDPSGFGEGRTFAGTVDIVTDGAGDAPFSLNLSGPAMSGEIITATASRLGMSGRSGKTAGERLPPMIPQTTSEFSPCFAVMTIDADVSITLADAPDPVAAGANITYTLNAANAGPVIADNTMVTIDTPPNTTFQSASAPVGWSVMSPPVDGSGTVTFSNAMLMTGSPDSLTLVVKVLNSTPGGTSIPASASISAAQNDPVPSNNSDATTTTVLSQADLSVDKMADVASAPPGGDIVYTVTLFNSGPDAASGVTLSDVVPTNTTFQSIVSPLGWAVMTPAVNGTGTITATRPTVGIKTTHEFTITVRVNPGVSGGTTITNTAVVSASTSDPDNTDNSDSVNVAVDAPAAQADLAVTRVPSPDPAVRGENLTYTITVSNNGPDTATSLQLTETLPDDVTFVSFDAPAGWTVDSGRTHIAPRGGGSQLTASAASMAPGTAAVFSLVVNVSLLTPDGTILSGNSVIASATPDPNPNNNAVATQTVVTSPPQTDLQLDKTASPSTVTPGSAITYTLVATNVGDDDAVEVSIADATPAGTTFVSATPSAGGVLTVPSVGGTGSISCVWPGITLPDESRTLTILVDVNDSVENGTTIVNSASAASDSFDSDLTNNSDSASVLVSTENVVTADVELLISSVPGEIDTGERLVYTLQVLNNGPDAATNVLLRTSTPSGTRLVSLTTTQGTVSAPPPGGIGLVEVAIGDIAAGSNVIVVFTVNVVAEGGEVVDIDVVIESDTNDPVAGNNAVSGSTGVIAGNDVLLTWDPPLPTDGDERNPPLHLQTQTLTNDSLTPTAAKILAPRNTLVGYNIYRSNTANSGALPANFFTSVPAGTTTVVAPTAPGGSFFTVTANYPNGESDGTNEASGGLPEPEIDTFQIKGNKVIINGSGFSDDVTVFIDGIPFTKNAKVKKQNTRIQQKGRLLTGQSVESYLTQQGGVILVSVLNDDAGIGTFLYRR